MMIVRCYDRNTRICPFTTSLLVANLMHYHAHIPLCYHVIVWRCDLSCSVAKVSELKIYFRASVG